VPSCDISGWPAIALNITKFNRAEIRDNWWPIPRAISGGKGLHVRSRRLRQDRGRTWVCQVFGDATLATPGFPCCRSRYERDGHAALPHQSGGRQVLTALRPDKERLLPVPLACAIDEPPAHLGDVTGQAQPRRSRADSRDPPPARSRFEPEQIAALGIGGRGRQIGRSARSPAKGGPWCFYHSQARAAACRSGACCLWAARSSTVLVGQQATTPGTSMTIGGAVHRIHPSRSPLNARITGAWLNEGIATF